MDRVPDSELMPLCAAAAIAWGTVVDYPALKLDSVELDEQLRHMEALLRLLMPVYGEYPIKVRKSDLYRALEALPSGPPPGEWWTAKDVTPSCNCAAPANRPYDVNEVSVQRRN